MNCEKSNSVKDLVCEFNSLYEAMEKSAAGVRWKDSVQGFYNNAFDKLIKLQKSLYDGTYKISKYTHFTVYEPKERDILATRFKDRVFQRSLCDNYLYDEITRHFIADNCACQKGKGTEYARYRIEDHLRSFYFHNDNSNKGYVLKIDIKNYFGSTSHEVAKNAIRKRVRNRWARKMVYDVIDSYEGDRGMGLGSQLVQLIQLSVLDDLDHYIKEQLHIKYYVRYMDDMILIHPDKEYLKWCLRKIKDKLEKIELKVNKKKTQVFPIKQQFTFLGMTVGLTKTGKVKFHVAKSKLINEERRLKKMVKRAKKGKMTKEDVDFCFRCYKGYIKNTQKHVKRSTKDVIEYLDKFYDNLWAV